MAGLKKTLNLLMSGRTAGESRVAPALRETKEYAMGKAKGAAAGAGATAAGYEGAKMVREKMKSDDEARRQSMDPNEMYKTVLTPDEMDVLEEYTRTKATKGSATKKAMGGKVGRGCGAAMRGGGAVMRKGRM